VLAIDHVIVLVHDLDGAAERLYDLNGLASMAGGRHAGYGTGNRIVPLGDSYIELMAGVDRDKAVASPLGSWVERRLAEVGEAPVAVCLRTDDIEATARRTGHPALAMSRTRPDGVTLDWQLVALEAALTQGLPFFIQWHVDDSEHPGRTSVEHRCTPTGIEWVELGGDEDRLASWLGEQDLPVRHVDPSPTLRFAVGVAGGEPIVIG
jgi:Glyoxalase-like domain